MRRNRESRFPGIAVHVCGLINYNASKVFKNMSSSLLMVNSQLGEGAKFPKEARPPASPPLAPALCIDGTNKRGRPCREGMDDIVSWCKTGLQELNSLAQDRRRWKLVTGRWSYGSWRRRNSAAMCHQCSRIRILRFFHISKKHDFLRFFETTHQKVVKSR